MGKKIEKKQLREKQREISVRIREIGRRKNRETGECRRDGGGGRREIEREAVIEKREREREKIRECDE